MFNPIIGRRLTSVEIRIDGVLVATGSLMADEQLEGPDKTYISEVLDLNGEDAHLPVQFYEQADIDLREVVINGNVYTWRSV